MTFSPPLVAYPPNPSAGTILQYTITPKSVIRLSAITFTLVTSATAGTRRVIIAIVRGTTTRTMVSFSFNGTTGASKTNQFTAANGIGSSALVATNFYAPLPPGPYPAGGIFVRIKVVGMKATDQLKNIVILYQESYG